MKNEKRTRTRGASQQLAALVWRGGVPGSAKRLLCNTRKVVTVDVLMWWHVARRSDVVAKNQKKTIKKKKNA